MEDDSGGGRGGSPEMMVAVFDRSTDGRWFNVSSLCVCKVMSL